jgi:hypothetical protein
MHAVIDEVSFSKDDAKNSTTRELFKNLVGDGKRQVCTTVGNMKAVHSCV